METIGKYQILEKIGAGGFGEVYKAYHPYIKRHVAVKTCLTDDQEVRNRFFQEAEIAGNLHHRNITTVYDFGIENDVPYLIQEYLSGEDLDRKIKRRDFLPYAEKLLYLIQIARGLAYAHSQGVIHRDVKPANIRILEDGLAKIMDFGIAKLAQRQTSLTQTGMTLGTAAYLAPEQIRGDAVDHRTDIFSFGVMAYELMTYERPFQGEQISAVIYQILNHEPKPIRENWPAVPAEMADLIANCLSKDPAQRCENGAALLRALEEVQKKGRPGGSEAAEPGAALAVPELLSEAPADTPDEKRDTGSIDELELSSVDLGEVRSGGQPGAGLAGAGLAGTGHPVAGRRSAGRRSAGRRSAGRPIASPATSTSIAVTAKTSPVPKIVLVVVLALVALGAGWWLGNPAPPDEPPAVGKPPPVGTVPGTTPTDVDVTAPPGTVGVTSSVDQTAADPEPAAPPPPPAATTGTVVFRKPMWTSAMVAEVAGVRRELARDRSVDLPPGRHTVTFTIDDQGYRRTATAEVDVRLGERHVVEIPIGQPGVLTVRPYPMRPQGNVTVGANALGKSPIRRHLLPPGEYLTVISPIGGGAAINKQIKIESGKETLLTFNLDTGDATDTIKDDS